MNNNFKVDSLEENPYKPRDCRKRYFIYDEKYINDY